MKNTKSTGFTLIELIVVIVILGILAALALPKFVSLTSDARRASVAGARGAIASSSALVHGKFLVTAPAPTTVSAEGTVVNIVNGYPQANAAFATAAGLFATDYTITAAGTTLTVSPISAPTAATCSVVYTQAAAGAAPTITTTTTGC